MQGQQGGESGGDRPLYSLGAVVRLTGLSAHNIRAWERRHGAVEPGRTPGGTRRYTEEQVARLRLLKAAVDAGHRISDLAALDDAAIERMLERGARADARSDLHEQLLEALERLDGAEVERLLAMQFHVLGPALFARDVASPLLNEIGERWARGDSCVASEHLMSAATRGILSAALRGGIFRAEAPRLVFTTPEGERHEFGALIAAVTALACGADVTYLGPDLPLDQAVVAAERIQPAALCLSVVNLAAGEVRSYLTELRRRLPESVAVWVGGPAVGSAVSGVEVVGGLEDLERRIARLQRQPGATARRS